MENQTKLNKSIDHPRRLALKTGAASVVFSALPLLSACSSSDTDDIDTNAAGTNTDTGNNAGSSNTGVLKIGLTIPLSGAFADEGCDQQRSFELAIQHLNGGGDAGMLSTMQPSSLAGYSSNASERQYCGHGNPCLHNTNG